VVTLLFEWIETRWIVTGAIILIVVILLNEFAYQGWKKANPGSLYSHLYDRTITPIDPSRPPTAYYE
jgi:hypothetical protein